MAANNVFHLEFFWGRCNNVKVLLLFFSYMNSQIFSLIVYIYYILLNAGALIVFCNFVGSGKQKKYFR